MPKQQQKNYIAAKMWIRTCAMMHNKNMAYAEKKIKSIQTTKTKIKNVAMYHFHDVFICPLLLRDTCQLQYTKGSNMKISIS